MHRLAETCPALQAALPFIFVFGPAIEGLYMGIRSGNIALVRDITTILGPFFGGLGKHNYEKLCIQMEALWHAMSPGQQWVYGVTATIATSDKLMHNLANDELGETTMNRDVQMWESLPYEKINRLLPLLAHVKKLSSLVNRSHGLSTFTGKERLERFRVRSKHIEEIIAANIFNFDMESNVTLSGVALPLDLLEDISKWSQQAQTLRVAAMQRVLETFSLVTSKTRSDIVDELVHALAQEQTAPSSVFQAEEALKRFNQEWDRLAVLGESKAALSLCGFCALARPAGVGPDEEVYWAACDRIRCVRGEWQHQCCSLACDNDQSWWRSEDDVICPTCIQHMAELDRLTTAVTISKDELASCNTAVGILRQQLAYFDANVHRGGGPNANRISVYSIQGHMLKNAHIATLQGKLSKKLNNRSTKAALNDLGKTIQKMLASKDLMDIDALKYFPSALLNTDGSLHLGSAKSSAAKYFKEGLPLAFSKNITSDVIKQQHLRVIDWPMDAFQGYSHGAWNSILDMAKFHADRACGILRLREGPTALIIINDFAPNVWEPKGMQHLKRGKARNRVSLSSVPVTEEVVDEWRRQYLAAVGAPGATADAVSKTLSNTKKLFTSKKAFMGYCVLPVVRMWVVTLIADVIAKEMLDSPLQYPGKLCIVDGVSTMPGGMSRQTCFITAAGHEWKDNCCVVGEAENAGLRQLFNPYNEATVGGNLSVRVLKSKDTDAIIGGVMGVAVAKAAGRPLPGIFRSLLSSHNNSYFLQPLSHFNVWVILRRVLSRKTPGGKGHGERHL